MNDKQTPVSVQILGKEYKIACATNEKDSLISCAQKLDKQMREIRDSGKVNGVDRIAVMAALNLVYDLTQAQQQNQNINQGLKERLTQMHHKIVNVLQCA